MRRKFAATAVVAIISAAMFLNGCGTAAATNESTTVETSTENTVTAVTESEEKTEETETEAEEMSDDAAVSQNPVRTEAVYQENSEFAGEGSLVFSNDQMGEFICLLSDLTVLPETMTDGETYVIYHSNVMAMSFPGQLPQVYSIRTLEDTYSDTIAVVKAVEEENIVFEEENGNLFAVSKESPALEGLELKEGDNCVISHTDAMTRSMPGIYMEVNRVAVLPAADAAEPAVQF